MRPSGKRAWKPARNILVPVIFEEYSSCVPLQAQTQTRTVSEVGISSAINLRIVFNYNEPQSGPDVNDITVEDLVLTIYGSGGGVCFTSGRVHRTLRRATAAAHHALDHHPVMMRLTGGGLTREQYAESLATMYRPHARLERLVHESRHHFELEFELSARLGLLAADLFDLGRPVPPVLQIPPDSSDGRAAWWGRVYVLEGSRQGSAVIAERIDSSLGDSVPCRFFGEAMALHEHGALLATLERELEDQEALEQAVRSARAAFAAYKAELDAFGCGTGNVEMH